MPPIETPDSRRDAATPSEHPLSAVSAASEPLSVFLVAGEASGDRLGAALIRGLKAETDRPLRLAGVGGAAMASEGLESLFPMAEIAVMGLTEVLPRLPTILRRIRQTGDAMAAAAPDLVVTIDAPDFGLRAAARARAALPAGAKGPLFAHYVAPSVWAWRPGRAKKMAKRTDHLLALLPFEPPYFERVGLSCDFVGHPAATLAGKVDPADPAHRAAFGLASGQPAIVVLPGSRRGELSRLGPVFGDVLERLAARRPGLAVLFPAADPVADAAVALADTWRARLPGVAIHALDPRGLPFEAAEARKLAAMAAADVALAASGTVSLELAAMRTPMAIAYKVSPLTAAIVGRLLKVDTVTLVNLVSETRAVPEFVQHDCQPDRLADALDGLMTPDSADRAAQADAAAKTMATLGETGLPPGQRAARSVLSALATRGG